MCAPADVATRSVFDHIHLGHIRIGLDFLNFFDTSITLLLFVELLYQEHGLGMLLFGYQLRDELHESELNFESHGRVFTEARFGQESCINFLLINLARPLRIAFEQARQITHCVVAHVFFV